MSGIRKKKLDKSSLKTHVVKAAAASFYRDGIKNVRMDDIASELSISKRTLYELFSDKEELLLEVAKVHHQEMLEYLKSVTQKAENVLEVIIGFYIRTTEDFQRTNASYYEDMKKYPRVMEYLEVNRRESARSAIAFYHKGVEQGIFRDDVNYHIVEEMIKVQTDALFHSSRKLPYPMMEIFETIVFMHIRGISTEKGLKIVDDFLRDLKQQKTIII